MATSKSSKSKTPTKKVEKISKETNTKRRKIWVPKFLRAIGGYFKGAWQELRQVRWPNRKATWSLTVAVIAFTLFWLGVIIGLDGLFNYVFNELILQ